MTIRPTIVHLPSGSGKTHLVRSWGPSMYGQLLLDGDWHGFSRMSSFKKADGEWRHGADWWNGPDAPVIHSRSIANVLKAVTLSAGVALFATDPELLLEEAAKARVALLFGAIPGPLLMQRRHARAAAGGRNGGPAPAPVDQATLARIEEAYEQNARLAASYDVPFVRGDDVAAICAEIPSARVPRRKSK